MDPLAQVLVGGVAPWNPETRYPGNPNGDWIQYFADILKALEKAQPGRGCDGFVLHTYTHGDDPKLITSEAKLDSFPNYHYHFRAYRDFLAAVPLSMRSLPCYITETDQSDLNGQPFPWTNRNTGWVKAAHAEIHAWNSVEGNQIIRALILYRWPHYPNDHWGIQGKEGVIEDFTEALAMRCKWTERIPPPVPELEKQTIELEAKVKAWLGRLQRLTAAATEIGDLQKTVGAVGPKLTGAASLATELDALTQTVADLEKLVPSGGDVTQPTIQDIERDAAGARHRPLHQTQHRGDPSRDRPPHRHERGCEA